MSTTRAATQPQFANLSGTASKPLFVVQLGFMGYLQYFSCSGPVTFDNEVYESGGATVANLVDGSAAAITLLATPERIAALDSGAWRNGQVCKIYNVPAEVGVEEAYSQAQGILVLDGVINSANAKKGTITISAVHKFLRGLTTPRINFNELSVLAPAAGTVIEQDGERYIIKGTR